MIDGRREAESDRPLGLSNEVLLGILSRDVVAPSPTKLGLFARQNQVDQGQSQNRPLIDPD